ncbi:DUF1064 domain-containing protein [Pseudoxanthomonas sp. PXM04]|nr:DUF1064 domain-containing protein [Pseudoxanthomonas sp. PXM04]
MGKGALRYASTESMPEGMRRLFERAQRNASGEVSEAVRRAVETVAGGGTKQGRARKYGNEITVVDGIRFDSKREARYYEQLKLRKAAGEVSHFLRQVPIHLPCGTKYVLDFLVFFADETRPPAYVDVKGRETKEFRIKKRGVEHHYPIRIELA